MIVAFSMLIQGYFSRRKPLVEAHRIALSVSPFMKDVDKLFEKIKASQFTEGELSGLQVILLLQVTGFMDKLLLLASEHVTNPAPAWSVLSALAYSKDSDWATFANSLKDKLDEQVNKKGFSRDQLAQVRQMHDLLHELGLVMNPIRAHLKMELTKARHEWKSDS